MRIAFLTGCLEAGRDGVGDYTRDLAAACVRSGHTAVAVALNDPHVVGEVREEQQAARGVTIETLRLQASLPWSRRSSVAGAWLARRDPDWISLQFVSYGLERKGVVFGLARHLAALIGGRRLHMMFHETWIGAERAAPLRHRLIGALQRAAILRLVRALAPAIVHTSNEPYRALLAAASVPARLLPLCGSVPVALPDGGWLPRELIRLGVPPASTEPRAQCWWFGLFGSLYSQWSPEPLFSLIAAAAEQSRRRVVIAAIGRQGHGEALWCELEKQYAPRFSLCALGERSTAEISWFLQGLDFGIATTPWQVIGKSATAAAMIDHGLPVIVTRDDVALEVPDAPAVVATEPLLHRLDGNLGRWLLEAPPREAPRDRLEELAARFLGDIQ